jgi:Protein of unknown function (DUF3987)
MSPSAAGAKQVRAIVDDAPEMTSDDGWVDPDMHLINDDRAPPPRLENDVLPAGWEPWIAGEAAARAGPSDYAASGLIGAASGWIGNARRIAANDDFIEPGVLWFGDVGAPSSGKTPMLRPMIEASRMLEREAEPAWREALSKHERDSEVARAIDKKWRDMMRSAANDNEGLPNRPPDADEPPRPIRPRVVTMDTSTEELQQILAESPRGLLYVRDELAGWFGSFDRYGGKGSDRAFFLECWNGDSFVCDRVRYHDAPLRIERASLAIVGGIVPERLREVLADVDDGLAARFIFIWPEPAPIGPLNNRGAADAAERRTMLHGCARRLRALEMSTDNYGRLAPRILRLAHDALVLFDEQRQEAMRRARLGSGLAAGWHGKNPGRILRLALVFEYLAWAARGDGAPEPTVVSADAVARAGGYIDYAAAMLDRVIAGLAIGPAEADAAQIARHVLSVAKSAPPLARLKPLNERALYQMRGFTWARGKKRRTDAFLVLQGAGWIRPRQADGHGRPAGDWEVNPRVTRLKL